MTAKKKKLIRQNHCFLMLLGFTRDSEWNACTIWQGSGQRESGTINAIGISSSTTESRIYPLQNTVQVKGHWWHFLSKHSKRTKTNLILSGSTSSTYFSKWKASEKTLPQSTHPTLNKPQTLGRLVPLLTFLLPFPTHTWFYSLLILWIPEVPCSWWSWGQKHCCPLCLEQWPRVKVAETWLLFHGHFQPKTHMSKNIISSEQKRSCTL